MRTGGGVVTGWSMPPLRDLPREALIGAVRGYRLLLKPSLGNACRFEPTCSQYALTALHRHGAVAGTALAGARILRCHPWCAGGLDPVPTRAPRLFAWLGLGAVDGDAPGASPPADSPLDPPAPFITPASSPPPTSSIKETAP